MNQHFLKLWQQYEPVLQALYVAKQQLNGFLVLKTVTHQRAQKITEGFRTKMEMLSRRAYGFRNFENYRLRVLAKCGWVGVIKRF